MNLLQVSVHGPGEDRILTSRADHDTMVCEMMEQICGPDVHLGSVAVTLRNHRVSAFS
jgi:hypothetical protein